MKTTDQNRFSPSSARRRLAASLLAAFGLLLVLLGVYVTAPPADATGDHGGWCYKHPTDPKCVDPEPTCETDPSMCEPEPCPPGTVRDATGECAPVVVTPPVEPPVKEPADDGKATPRDPPMNPPNKTTGGNDKPETTTGCGWSRTVHPNGRITWGDGYDCSDTKEEGF